MFNETSYNWGLGDARSDCLAKIAQYPQNYSFKGSRYQLSVPAYLPGLKTTSGAIQDVQSALQSNGIYGITVTHPGGFSEAQLVISGETSYDNANQNDVRGVFESAARQGFYLRSGSGSFVRTHAPDPCAGIVGGTITQPGVPPKPPIPDSTPDWLKKLAESLGMGVPVAIAVLGLGVVFLMKR